MTELAAALRRPKSTVAHHVNVLSAAGLLRVVRTRRVRAVDERFYGRTARMFYVGLGRRAADGGELPPDFNDFEVAAKELAAAYEASQLRAYLRHARLDEATAARFRAMVEQVVHEFDQLPRSGNTVHGFAVGLYPLPDHPTLPPRDEKPGAAPQ